MNQRRPPRAAVLALFLTASSSLAGTAQTDDSKVVRQQAFELAYNLDHEPALALLRRSAATTPSDPATHRALASVLWLNMLFRRGAITVDHYLGSFSRTQVELSRPPADLDAEFRRHVARAVQLADAGIAASRRDAQSYYDLGAAVGLQASHIATVEGKMLAGFKAAKRAYDAHEHVVELDPSRKEAGLVIGTYRYVVSTLSLPLRMMAYVAGFGGGRQRGIEILQETAAHPGESRTDALFALVLIYNRERRYDEALEVLGRLRRMYPRNRLVLLEAGATALRGGRSAQADDLLTEGLGMLKSEKRERMPGEEGLWRYKRGIARIALNRLEAGKADLAAAIAPDAQEWVRGRAHTELARVALRAGDRPGARALALRAEALCKQGSDPVCVAEARDLVRSTGGR